MQPVHRQQQRLGEEAEEPAVAHHQVNVVVKAAADAGQGLVFLRPGEQVDLALEGLAGREGQAPDKPAPLRSLAAAARWWPPAAPPRRSDAADRSCGPPFLGRLLRHRRQREELVVGRHPDHVARPRRDTRAGGMRGMPAARATKSSSPPRLVGLRAVIPEHAHGTALVARAHRRGRADHPFLGRQRERLRRAVLQPHRRRHQVVRAELEFLHDAQAVGEGLLRAHPVVGPGQREDAVALHRLAVEQRQSRRGRERVQRGQVIGLRLLLAALGDRFRVMDQLDQLQAAAMRGEGVTRVAVRQLPATPPARWRSRGVSARCAVPRRPPAPPGGCAAVGWRQRRRGGIGGAGRQGLGRVDLIDQRIPEHQHDETDHQGND